MTPTKVFLLGEVGHINIQDAKKIEGIIRLVGRSTSNQGRHSRDMGPS